MSTPASAFPPPNYTPPNYPPAPNQGTPFSEFTDEQWKAHFGWAAECLRIDVVRHEAWGYDENVLERWRKAADEYERRSH